MSDDAYDDLADDYHWLLSDDLLSGATFARQYGDVLDRLPAGAAVLDCACGIGADAVAMARRGFRVWATDASAGMVEQARRRVAGAAVDVPVSLCRWEELPLALGRRFEAVFCLGNSLAHLAGADAMAIALAGMRAVLEPGGVLVVDSRDWECLRAERPRITVADRVIERDGVRCTSLYVWTLPETWDAPHGADIVFVLERGGPLTYRRHQIHFVPFRRDDLTARVRAAGFDQVEIQDQDAGRYRLSAVAAPGSERP